MTRVDLEPAPSAHIENLAPVILSSPDDGKQFPLGGVNFDASTIADTDFPDEPIFIKAGGDIFDSPISTGPPLAMFERKGDHPVNPAGVVNMNGVPVGTNKFWGNLVLGNGNLGVFAQPYQLWVNKDANIWGLAISHTDASQLVYGPDPNSNPVQYYFNPVGINSLTLSATEFNVATSSVTVESLKPHSAMVTLWANRSLFPSSKRLSSVLVQGMGFVTGRYLDLTPKISSGVLVRSFSYAGTITGNGVARQKWRVTLNDGKEWRIYAVPNSGTRELQLQLINGTIQATGSFSGIIQIAKLPNTALEYVLDQTAGTVVTDATVSATVAGTVGTYKFSFTSSGASTTNSCLMYALPHQVESFDSATRSRLFGGLQLKATTKGLMTGIVANSWTLLETDMPVSVGWLPGSNRKWTAKTLNAIRAAIASEINYDVVNDSNLSSQYFSGKHLAKYAQVVLVACDVLKDAGLVQQGLAKLKTAIDRFAQNRQIFPLVYDTKWGGLSSSSWWKTGNDGEDFGNAFYNDHHFHYGYFIYTAALLAHIEKTQYGTTTWLTANRGYVNNLVRDVANPSQKDKYFPVSRSFDFFNGHSWATGLYARTDGKDEESTSEDYNFSYAMKLWGNVIGDANMEARANLQLAILKRSLNSYFLMSNNNRNQPGNFIQNKVTGILFENKVDHTTYFGNQIEYIQGIHMLPLTPVSPYVRSKQFCMEEWSRYFEGRTDTINSGWKGVLWANAAIFAPNTAFNFIAGSSFQANWLDDGATRTWYLVFAAGLGGGN
ncbi:hypothetical protein H072_9865 [Dactylellina haptotyla CBS 200.50]|uniref:glucan endo-1,3-beta-D-glucosidase n=1 Tax=Dactylellina haptotyla (strain CBS 200.50) TaxID=1284197 RepID=S8BBP0_DACHA|nr:hypothetical protein H072_9865 [Dactylellina haptotyla CBS 200.50]